MKSVLLMIDFINDIVHPDGKIAAGSDYIQEYGVLEKANEAMAWARGEGIDVMHVKVGFSPSYIECPTASPLFAKAPEFGALQLGSWGTEFHDALTVGPEEKVFVKHRVNAFYGTDLEPVLRAQGIEKLYLAGVSTNMAITHTAREAHDRDYQVVVIADACGAHSREVHEAELLSLARIASIQ